MRTHWRWPASGLLAVLILVGCTTSPETKYEDSVKSQIPMFAHDSDDTILMLGKAACNAWRDGMAFQHVNLGLQPMKRSDEKIIAASASKYLCPGVEVVNSDTHQGLQ